MKVAFLLVATGRYKEFVAPLYDGLQHVFPDTQRRVVVCTDAPGFQGTPTFPIHCFYIPRKGFPYDTLFRYHYFLDAHALWADADVVVYMDVDMKVMRPLLWADLPHHVYQPVWPPHRHVRQGSGALLAVCHPGFVRNAQRPFGSPETRPQSRACLTQQVVPYVCGGVQGGTTEAFATACRVMRQRIDDDMQDGIMPVWHDESVWNKYVNECADQVTLYTPSLCYALRQAPLWGLHEWEPIITTIDKDHKYFRSE